MIFKQFIIIYRLSGFRVAQGRVPILNSSCAVVFELFGQLEGPHLTLSTSSPSLQYVSSPAIEGD